MKNFGWSSDSDDVEILTSRNFPTEEETVEEQCNVNLEDGDGDNVEDGEDGEDGDGVNLISTSSSGLFEPFIGKEFDEVEDAQAFYKALMKMGVWAVAFEQMQDQEHLAHGYNKYPDFQKEFHHCIHDTITPEEFEDEWVSILVKYGLACNDWMQNLYNRREKWVPAYLRTTFCAGMSTTQRSESMNKFFKDYVRSSTMVSDFVHQYEKALSARYFKEKEKDVRTKSSNPILRTCWKIEEETVKVYTRKSFNIFQEELFNCQRYKMIKVQQYEESKMYEVAPNGKDGRIYYVTLDSRQTQAICTCHKFEFLGILCRHILCVFMKKSNLDMLPHHYVLERWTINAKSRAILEIPNSEGPFPTREDPILRKSHLMMQFYDIAELGSQSRFKMNQLSLALDKVHKELLSMENIGEQNLEAGDMSCVDSPMIKSQVISNFFQILQDPQRMPTKGRPKSLRSKNLRETQSVKKRRCGICKVEGHTRNNCPSLGDIGNINDNISQKMYFDTYNLVSVDIEAAIRKKVT
ncbi:protein FAR1-RELATED SEQUENCE 5-like [Carya illinoinensis]|uniref:protein FAR1-RELATED SEQUENCE 5-like n=1 Tax=Carya illinoinensis TaxID=32201 RepID=UPI001C717F18|nr:protein FAR1-RELATED SEQUENCE 5-like [Carya illinoinensis]